MTSLPHVFLCVEVDFGGKIVKGISSEGLPPKWFTKNPDTTFEEDLPEMAKYDIGQLIIDRVKAMAHQIA